MNETRGRIRLAIVLVQSVAAVSTAQAQIEEIIVTAERREASLQETAISISVMDEKTLAEYGSSRLVELGDFAPNVKMHEMPGKAGAATSMRGFYNAETIATFDPKVALYLDGVLIGKNTGSAFDILDLERVEILRGPQGTLYGRNTTGGAINMITRKPTDVLEGSLSVTMGAYNQRDLKGSVNVPLLGANGVLSDSAQSSLNLKVTLGTLNRDGYWDNPVWGNEPGDKNRDVAHVQLHWLASDALSVMYAYDKTDIDEVPWPGQVVGYNPVTQAQLAPYMGDGGSSDRPMDADSWMEADIEGHGLTVEWALDENLSLVSITALRKMENDSYTDSDATPRFVFHNQAGDKIDTFTEELRLVGSAMDSRLEYVAGGFFMDEDIKDSYSVNIMPRFGMLKSGLFATAKNEIWALFGQVTYDLTDRLELAGGLRYTKEDRQMTRNDWSFIPAFGTNTVTFIGDVDKNFYNTSGMLSLSYKWNEDLMSYAKVSTGYASGGFNPRSPTPALFSIGYDEETVISYEVGLKSSWLEDRLLFNVAVFYNDFKDLQVPMLTADARNNLGNADKATIKGFEAEVRAVPIENLEIGGGYGYLDPEYETFFDPFGNNVKNNEWAQAPQDSLNFFSRYVVPAFLSLGDLSLRLDWSYRSKYSLLTSPGNMVGSYDFLNARIGLDEMRGPGETTFSVAIWGKNLTDELYYTSGYNLVSSLGFNTRYVGAPRTFGIDLTMRF